MTRNENSAGMISTDDLDRMFELARAHPPREEEWAAMLRAEPRAGRIVRRWSWITGVAAAAVFGLVLLGWPRTPTASAFSSIAKATREADVVKRIIESEYRLQRRCELWTVRGRFSAQVDNDGEVIQFRDIAAGEVARFQRGRNAVIRSTFEAGEAERDFSSVQSIEDVTNWLESLGQDSSAWVRRTIEREGRSLVEYTNESDTRSYFRRFVADAATSRLVEIDSGHGLTRFEYPETAPRDIFDLGTPRDARVIDGRAPEAVGRLREQVMAQAAGGFGAYRAAVVQNGEPAELIEVISDGVRVRARRHSVPNPVTTDDLLRAAREFLLEPPPSHTAKSASIFDGQQEMQVIFDANHQPVNRSVRARAFATYWANTLEGHSRILPGGFIGSWGDTQIEFLGPDARGWVGFRQRGQANEVSRPYLHEKWYDPAHGYREVVAIHTDSPNADWQLDADWAPRYAQSSRGLAEGGADASAHRSEAEVTEWAELRPGLWYPRLRTWRSLALRDDGTWALREWPNCETCRAVTHVAIVAEPLESVDPAEFAIPPAWLEVPVTQ